ncbi:hypothetical protein NBRC3299_2625 [Acetobacter pasteurianus NBRC 3299]|uniref:Bro-N domain-containing protein n=1 Tax=Acetobacter ascendens TaxID=481146 RepID=A0A1Y0V675_9PROT|nr:hypothetical protein S101447_02866 [Acetobacter ascendens]GCD76333.1 hypothetical protein NBRC3299_2625 [Acetobacter pasteurianus NBRC 3299]
MSGSNDVKLAFEGKILKPQEHRGQRWFLAKDVCQILELRSAKGATRLLDDDEVCLLPTATAGGTQNLIAVNESGAYHLTFTSRKPVAKRFRRWVFWSWYGIISNNCLGCFCWPWISSCNCKYQIYQFFNQCRGSYGHDCWRKGIMDGRIWNGRSKYSWKPGRSMVGNQIWRQRYPISAGYYVLGPYRQASSQSR